MKVVVAMAVNEVISMNSEQQIWQKSIVRLAKIFSINEDRINLSDRFGMELKPSFISDFKDNELDVINNDIHDVADKKLASDLETGRLVVTTVKDYCEFMVLCSRSNLKEVMCLLTAARSNE